VVLELPDVVPLAVPEPKSGVTAGRTAGLTELLDAAGLEGSDVADPGYGVGAGGVEPMVAAPAGVPVLPPAEGESLALGWLLVVAPWLAPDGVGVNGATDESAAE
jgi:hypothetical protein